MRLEVQVVRVTWHSSIKSGCRPSFLYKVVQKPFTLTPDLLQFTSPYHGFHII